MSKRSKCLMRLLKGGKADVEFEPLVNLLVYIGFERRDATKEMYSFTHRKLSTRGIHPLALQNVKQYVKDYQKRQVRKFIYLHLEYFKKEYKELFRGI